MMGITIYGAKILSLVDEFIVKSPFTARTCYAR